MIEFPRHLSPVESTAYLRLYLHALRRKRAKEGLKKRLSFLKANPGALTIADLDLLGEAHPLQRKSLFEVQPDIREQYLNHNGDPANITKSLLNFTKQAFRHTGLPGRWRDAWHIDLLCEEWEAFLAGEHLRGILNQPPDTTKSLISNIMVPAFAFAKNPGWQGIEISYGDGPPKKDGETLMRLMRSPWYRRHFPATEIQRGDSELFWTTAGGYRRGSTVGSSITGWHPDLIVFDDPHKASDVTSEKLMKKVISYYSTTIPSRGSGMSQSEDRRTAVVVVMQRLAPNDLCGVILQESGAFDDADDDIKSMVELCEQMKWHHVCLPMFFEPDHRYRYPKDPRTKKGELLLSNVTEAEVRARMREMEMNPDIGGMTTTAQYQQDPLLSDGGFFDLDNCWIEPEEYRQLKLTHGRAVRCWDRADSTTGDETAGVLMIEKDGCYCIADVKTMKKRHMERDAIIERYAKADQKKFGPDMYRVAIEKPTGPDGQSAFDATYARLRKSLGVLSMSVPAVKNKQHRATTLAGMLKYGEARIFSDKSWKNQLHSQFRRFPLGDNDDIVDAASGALYALTRWGEGKV